MTEDERKEDLAIRVDLVRMANQLNYPMSRAQECYDFIRGKKFFKERKKKTLKTEDGFEVPIHGSVQ